MSTESEKQTPDAPEQTPAGATPQPEVAPSGPAAGEAATPESKSSQEPAKRKIRIGSQRSATPVSPLKPAPQSLDMRPPKPPAEQAPASPAAPESAATEAESAEATPSTPQEKPEQPSFSDLAAQQSPEIAASVAKVLGKTAEAAEPTEASQAETIAPEDVPEIQFKEQSNEDLEQEIEAALGGMSLDDILAGEEQATAKAGEQLAVETRLPGTVMKVDREYVFFALGNRNQGVAGRRQFKQPPEPGEAMDVVVQRFDAEEGLYEVTVPGASVEVADWGDVTEGVVVEARVTGHNTGGLECEVNHLRGFIPMSQISLHRVDNAEEYVGQKLACVVTEANQQRQNLVLSHRAMLEREQEENREKLFTQLEVGQVHKATVRKLMDFGAFAEIAPGVDGLIHISQLSWDRVNHPSDVLKEGQQVEVKIEKIDPDTRKIGLSYRELQDNPWNNVTSKYPTGTMVSGTVSRVAQFGAFVKLEPGVEGLVHVSELAHHRVHRVDSVVTEGQEVEVKVLEVDEEKQRIGLSMKAATQPPPAESKPAEPEDDAPEEPRELAVAERKGPLKGGMNKKSGGDKFGLNW